MARWCTRYVYAEGHVCSYLWMSVLSGQAMGGTLSALASILDLAVASDITNSALVYFVMATAYTIFCMFLYGMLCRMPIARLIFFLVSLLFTCKIENSQIYWLFEYYAVCLSAGHNSTPIFTKVNLLVQLVKS